MNPRKQPAVPSDAGAWPLLLINGGLIAAIYACAKVAVEAGVPVLAVLAWQLALAATLIAILAAARGEWPAASPDNLRYALLAGVLGVSGPNLLGFSALTHLPAGLVGAFIALSPVFTYLFALAFRLEGARATGILGIVLGFAGALALARPSAAPLPGGTALLWILPAIATPLMLAGANLYRSMAWPSGLKPLSAAALMLALQAILVVPAASAAGDILRPASAGTAGLLAVLAAGGLMAAFYLSAFELQRRAGPVLVGQLGNVIAVASLVIGVLLLGERYSPGTLVAAALVVGGVALVSARHACLRSGECA